MGFESAKIADAGESTIRQGRSVSRKAESIGKS
jgi:hypothetical protein